MIDKAEIQQKSKEFEIKEVDVERDYIFGWFLFGLFTISKYKRDLFLKGGNALRKGYFENTRYSSDLDFGYPSDIDADEFLNEANGVCNFISEKTGITFLIEQNQIKEKFSAGHRPLPNLHVYELRIYFKDFYGQSDHMTIKISMDITRFDKVLLPVQNVPLIHPYSDIESVRCDIRCMKLEEIIATKLKCLLQRQYAPDLFDYVYSIQLLGGELDREEVVKTFVKKTIFDKNPHIVKEILVQTPFDVFKQYWQDSIVCAKAFVIDLDYAVGVFRDDLEGLFSIFTQSAFAQYDYFGAEFRNMIMQAGREKTLLKICYKGEDRFVEPYSLKYMEAKGGSNKEYLYVHQVEGSSGTGIRMMQSINMQSMENTERKFDPQFPIELSKSGERPEQPYLFDPNKPKPSPRRRRPRGIIGRYSGSSSFYPKYTHQCLYCGKKFTRKNNTTKLNKHKDKDGFQCPGRTGFYVGTKY